MSTNKILYGLIALVALGLLAIPLLFERIEPGEIGVRQSLWGGSGVAQADFGVGYHLGVTGVHKWHIVDARTHFLTFSEASGQLANSRRNQNSQQKPPLVIRTSDNNVVKLDVTVVYRVMEGHANQLVSDGRQLQYRDRVASKVQSVLREELSKLTPEYFQLTERRLESAAAALPILAASIEEFHVEPELILIRAVRFLENYEGKLQQKQLTEQQKKLEAALRLVEDSQRQTGSIEKKTEAMEKEERAKWDKRLQTAKSDNEVAIAEVSAAAHVYQNEVRPTADAVYEKLVADGLLAVQRAEALRDELRNAALDTAGGRILQARQAAENLNFESVTLNSNDPSVPSVIDIDALTKLLIGGGSPAASGD